MGSSHTRRVLPALLLSAAVCLVATAHGQPATHASYTEVFYPSATLQIHAYLYRPDGPGPSPIVIYNHGSRVGRERQPMPFEYIGRLLTRAGYVVLVPERRGYGRSEGLAWPADVGGDKGRFVGRLEAETDDVLAALPYLRTLPSADTSRVGIMGTLLQVAENDRTTDSITALGAIFQKRGVAHRMVIYGPFGPSQSLGPGAPGHQIFSVRGMHVWEADVLEFLGRHLGPGPPKP